MARHRGRYAGRSNGARRRTDWNDFLTEVFTLGTTAVQLGATSFTTILGTETLARIHGELMVTLNTATSINDGFTGAVGIGKVQDEAFQAGVGSVPSPVTESSWDGWLYHQFFEVRALSTVEAELIASPASTFRRTVDVKSMRKVDDQENFILVMEAIEVGTAVGVLSFQSRALSLLP